MEYKSLKLDTNVDFSYEDDFPNHSPDDSPNHSPDEFPNHRPDEYKELENKPYAFLDTGKESIGIGRDTFWQTTSLTQHKPDKRTTESSTNQNITYLQIESDDDGNDIVKTFIDLSYENDDTSPENMDDDRPPENIDLTDDVDPEDGCLPDANIAENSMEDDVLLVPFSFSYSTNDADDDDVLLVPFSPNEVKKTITSQNIPKEEEEDVQLYLNYNGDGKKDNTLHYDGIDEVNNTVNHDGDNIIDNTLSNDGNDNIDNTSHHDGKGKVNYILNYDGDYMIDSMESNLDDDNIESILHYDGKDEIKNTLNQDADNIIDNTLSNGGDDNIDNTLHYDGDDGSDYILNYDGDYIIDDSTLSNGADDNIDNPFLYDGNDKIDYTLDHDGDYVIDVVDVDDGDDTIGNTLQYEGDYTLNYDGNYIIDKNDKMALHLGMCGSILSMMYIDDSSSDTWIRNCKNSTLGNESFASMLSPLFCVDIDGNNETGDSETVGVLFLSRKE